MEWEGEREGRRREQAEESTLKGMNRELAPGVWKSVECSHNVAVEGGCGSLRAESPLKGAPRLQTSATLRLLICVFLSSWL